jgi:hypothetical protein
LDNELKDQQAMIEAAISEQKERERMRERVWADAVGRKLGKLKTTKGKAYEDAVINEVSAAGISIQHASGSSRVPFEDLPDLLQKDFGYDPAGKDKMKSLEKRLQMTHEQRMAAAADRNTEKKSTPKIDTTEQKARLNRNLALYGKQVAQLQNEIRNLESDLSAEEKKSSETRNNGKFEAISRAPQLREAIAQKNQELKQAQLHAAIVKAELEGLP